MSVVEKQAMGSVSKSVIGKAGVIVIDNPPENALASDVSALLLEALKEFDQDGSVVAIIITGVSGRFLTNPPAVEGDWDDISSSLFAVIETINKPVIAAITGPALDIGLELSLACDLRIATSSATAGLPGLMLGQTPSAGATQRLPRLIGIANAIDLVASRPLTAREATETGLFDRVECDVIEAALGFSESGGKSRLSQRAVVSGNADAEKRSLDSAVKRAKGVTAATQTATLIAAAASSSFDEGLLQEHEIHQRLRHSEEAKALQYLKRAEAWAETVPDLEGVEPKTVDLAAVVGAGTMGSGIAVSLATAGLPVIVLEQTTETAKAGRERIAGILQSQQKSGRISETKSAEILSRLQVTENWGVVKDADLVIEAAFEDLAVKSSIFQKLNLLAKPDAVLATNTSYLDVNLIAEQAGRAADVVGLHFFSPAHVMRLLEVVQADKTAPAVLATALSLARRIGKLPIVARVCDGFIGNRIFAIYRRHAEYLVEDGASPQEIDEALQAFGFAMGPFAVSDMSGLDIAWAMRKRRAATRDPGERYVSLPDLLCEADRLGRKTGGGWYDYVDGKRLPSPAVADIIEAERKRREVRKRSFTPQDIQKRILAVMANEGAKVLEERISARASDIDLVFVNGYGFPQLRGGPMFATDQFGLSAILAEVEEATRIGGTGSEPSALLVRLANEGRTFAEWQRETHHNT
ncbi:3-hydroxyacyl-CoA dehydrogenase NAD-binding domain-containing protein [Mesorhizobium sp. YR577]|uniref:3-hydroxyacyl-CoA dehydrogenase NAD-binding domain-containing protein n=1 Tax=Mesorhizobium sp. YR577 TaxID=1884373 RepID=UPI0008EC5D1C|nr:3-hydroxyacyl-CoA dehydrogenase NAD-binding domain-containing protein [Mesorhizobium sp. YR577]SFU17277.1 3-hydroxyacyl-CoA dehydrogenase [Mesorhizobium sp. YR577]